MVLKWDGELGAVVEAMFPKNLPVTPSFANQIFSMHFSGDLSTASDFVCLQTSDKKIISKLLDFGSIKRSVSLIMHKYEPAQGKEEKLIEISEEISSNLDYWLENLESLYKQHFSLCK
ncbi:MAG: hypothetical protein QXO71_07620 [Candidatus Jordarchaeaceae archaeon]